MAALPSNIPESRNDQWNERSLGIGGKKKVTMLYRREVRMESGIFSEMREI